MAVTFNLYRNTDNTLSGSYPLGDKPSSFTPFLNYRFSGANLDQSTTEFSNTSTPNRIYSTEQTGPFGEQSNLKLTAVAGNNFFGGSLVSQAVSWPDVQDGDTIWIRSFHYFPTSFCVASGNTSETPWGGTKWIRLQWGTPSDAAYSRLTLQLGEFFQGACATDLIFKGCTLESFGGSSNAFFPTQAVIPRDQWVSLQFSVKIGVSGWIRGWVGDTYVGQWDGNTLPDGLAFGMESFVLGDYWNGSPSQTSSWYVQDVIATIDPPATTDGGGRAYISPQFQGGL